MKKILPVSERIRSAFKLRNQPLYSRLILIIMQEEIKYAPERSLVLFFCDLFLLFLRTSNVSNRALSHVSRFANLIYFTTIRSKMIRTDHIVFVWQSLRFIANMMTDYFLLSARFENLILWMFSAWNTSSYR